MCDIERLNMERKQTVKRIRNRQREGMVRLLHLLYRSENLIRRSYKENQH